jgi:hypothetical protein
MGEIAHHRIDQRIFFRGVYLRPLFRPAAGKRRSPGLWTLLHRALRQMAQQAVIFEAATVEDLLQLGDDSFRI